MHFRGQGACRCRRQQGLVPLAPHHHWARATAAQLRGGSLSAWGAEHLQGHQRLDPEVHACGTDARLGPQPSWAPDTPDVQDALQALLDRRLMEKGHPRGGAWHINSHLSQCANFILGPAHSLVT